jgi:hypothetical protein
MKFREYRVRAFGDPEKLFIVDNRQTDVAAGELEFNYAGLKVIHKKTGEEWQPLVIIPVGPRYSASEALEFASMIRDRLNAAWTEQQLKG